MMMTTLSLFSITIYLNLVATWFKANKLTLHPEKTKFIIFHPSGKDINSSNLTTICIIDISINLLVVYRESVNLIGYITRRLSADSLQL